MDTKIDSLNARRKFKDRLILTLGLRRKPLNFFCDRCGKLIQSDMPWECGSCDHRNYRTKLYSFLNKCAKCKVPPASLECPHCSVFLSLHHTGDTRHPARKIRPPEPYEPRDKKLERLVNKRQERETELQHELFTTRLNAELAALEKEIENAKKDSPYKELQESRSKRKARFVAAHMIAKQEREANEEKYSDDKNLLEMANAELQEWLENEALSPSTDKK